MGFFEKGKKVEQEFAKQFSDVSFSSKHEDINEHWDVKVSHKYDVKGLKKRRRSDDSPDESVHWIEIKNVRGDKGWLYGEADYFAFELCEYWLIVDKLKLQEYIAENTIKQYSIIPTLNKLYRRNGREDIITLVSTIDLIYVSDDLIKKDEK